jgi:hypothetical protein
MKFRHQPVITREGLLYRIGDPLKEDDLAQKSLGQGEAI